MDANLIAAEPFYQKKLINPGLYVLCKVNDDGTTAKPAGLGWLLTFTDQTYVNVPKYRNQHLQTL